MHTLISFFKHFVTVFFCLSVIPAYALEILHSHTDEIDDHFILSLDVRINADFVTVRNIITDYDNIMTLNDSIKVNNYLFRTGSTHYVHIESEGCVLIFCKRVIQYLTIKEQGNSYIMVNTDPEKSSLSFGSDLFELVDEGETTRLIYSQDMQPDFWIPPLIGSWLIESRLLEEALKTAQGIERVAQQD